MKDRDLTATVQREQLHSAARRGDLAAVERWLTARYPVNRFDSIGKTPLHYAVQEGHTPVVERLLRAGANVNAHDERWAGNTPLSDSVRSMSLAMAERLIDAGADPLIRGWMQLSAMDRARDRTDDVGKAIRRLLADAAATT